MRKLSVALYGTAFLISLIIFLSGVFVGSVLDTSTLEGISSEVEGVSTRVASLQILLLMEGNSSSFCPVYLSDLESIDNEMEQLGHKLTYLEEQKNVQDPELKKQYFVVQAQSYLLSKKVNEICEDKSILLINFYSNKDCDLCSQQGIEVLKARDHLSGETKVKLYSFDGELGSPIVKAFKDRYSVRSYPTLVINEKHYPGYHSSNEIADIIRELDDS